MRFTFDSLTDLDIANICLQRTGFLFDYSSEGQEAFIQWHNNKKLSPLLSFVENNSDAKQKIISDWAKGIHKEYIEVKENLPTNINHVCDIGCGYSMFDLFLYNDYNPKLTLIDIEITKEKRHLFNETIISGYSSNVSTYNLLVENNVSSKDINLINPIMNKLPTKRVFDIIFSSVSLGFHYPLATYEDFIFNTLNIGGSFIFDHRVGFDDIEDFTKRFKSIESTDYKNTKHQKIYCNEFLG